MAEPLTEEMGQEELGQAAEESTECSRPPTSVPGYRLERLLGKGAFGEVWLALNENTNLKVAIKFYARQGGLDLSLLMREVDKLRLLATDRYVVQLLEVGWKADPPFYVMEHFEQGSLEDRLRNGPLTVAEAVVLFREMVEGMSHAHDKGILHCDLKPANILLDQDHKPRLADFGQARLTEEHVQSLGTLFYMPPEQTLPQAEPDVRWDVYALGVILYRMLTGQLPHHSKESAAYVQEGDDRERRLRRYRRAIRKSRSPLAHRKIPGVDSALKNIIDRCLAVNPDKRFPNVRSILNALDQRALKMAQRPLLILGALGPVFLTLVILYMAWSMYREAVVTVDGTLADYALKGNRSTAKFAAEAVASRFRQRWAILEREAADMHFRAQLRQAAQQQTSDAAKPLNDHLDELSEKYSHTKTFSSWFVTDRKGNLLAIGPQQKRDLAQKKGALKNYWWRNFFHGKNDQDYDQNDSKQKDVQPIDQAHRSIVFESSSEGKPRITVFSVPVQSDAPEHKAETIGVLAMAVQLGEFEELRSEGSQQETVVLVETRKDWEHEPGLILQHPELERWKNREDYPRVRLDSEQLAELTKLVHEPGSAQAWVRKDYRDPFGKYSPTYAEPWLVVAEPVHFQKRLVIRGEEQKETRDVQTGWVVLVQEPYSAVVGQVDQLKRGLAHIARFGLASLLAVVVLLWGFTAVMLNPSLRPRLYAYLRRRAGLPSETLTGTRGSSVSRSASGVSGSGRPALARTAGAGAVLSGDPE